MSKPVKKVMPTFISAKERAEDKEGSPQPKSSYIKQKQSCEIVWRLVNVTEVIVK
jgi:hypothetical protein